MGVAYGHHLTLAEERKFEENEKETEP